MELGGALEILPKRSAATRLRAGEFTCVLNCAGDRETAVPQDTSVCRDNSKPNSLRGVPGALQRELAALCGIYVEQCAQ